MRSRYKAANRIVENSEAVLGGAGDAVQLLMNVLRHCELKSKIISEFYSWPVNIGEVNRHPCHAVSGKPLICVTVGLRCRI